MNDPDVPHSGVTTLDIFLGADAQVIELAGRCKPLLVTHASLYSPDSRSAVVGSSHEVPDPRDMKYVRPDTRIREPEQFVNFSFHSTGYIGM
jgi:hypothetical protein